MSCHTVSVEHIFPDDSPRPPQVPLRKSGYYAMDDRPLRPREVESLMIRKVVDLMQCTDTYMVNMNRNKIIAMCKELEVTIHQHENYVDWLLQDDMHETILFDNYWNTLQQQVHMVVPVSPCTKYMGSAIVGVTLQYVAYIQSELSTMQYIGYGYMLNAHAHSPHNTMLMRKITAILLVLHRSPVLVSISTQYQLHAMCLLMLLAIQVREKYVNQFLSNAVDEARMYNSRKTYLMLYKQPNAADKLDNTPVSECEERRTINADELIKMTAKGITDPYNSILGLSQPPLLNSNYIGKFHHGWKDLAKPPNWT